MRRTRWIAAAATAIALAIPGAAAADSIVLAGGHHWDGDDHGGRHRDGDEGGGHGFQAVALSAIGGGSSISTGAVTINVGTNNGTIDVTVGGGGAATGGSGGTVTTPTPRPANGVVPQVSPIAFTSTPTTPIVMPSQTSLTLPGTSTAGAAGTVLGSLPMAGGSSLLLVRTVNSVVSAAAPRTSATPEPASLILLATGLVGGVVRKRWFA